MGNKTFEPISMETAEYKEMKKVREIVEGNIKEYLPFTGLEPSFPSIKFKKMYYSESFTEERVPTYEFEVIFFFKDYEYISKKTDVRYKGGAMDFLNMQRNYVDFNAINLRTDLVVYFAEELNNKYKEMES